MTTAHPLRGPDGRARRGPDGRAILRRCGAAAGCCAGGAPGCRYYPAVLCSTWLCEPPVMATILPGAGATVWLCVCSAPGAAAPLGQVFRIQTRCYRITGDGVERDAVPDADWLYDCRGILSPPVGSALAASEHRLIAEPAGCNGGSCAVNLCGRYVQLTPCGGGPGCTRPVFARADQFAYGRAVAVLCPGSPPVTRCFCAEATSAVVLSSQLPADAVIWNFQATLEGCCACAQALAGPCCRARTTTDYNRRDPFGVPGGPSAPGRSVACCCNLAAGAPSIAGEFLWGDFSLRIVDATVLARSPCAISWRGFIDWTGRGAAVGDPPPPAPGPGPIRSGRLGPFEWTLRCGGTIDTPPQQAADLVNALRDLGILDPITPAADYQPWHLPLLLINSGAVSARQDCGRAAVSLSGVRGGAAFSGTLALAVETTDMPACQGCGSDAGPGDGDVGGLIP